MRRCAIYPCRTECPDGRVTCDDHHDREHALLSSYRMHVASENAEHARRHTEVQSQRDMLASLTRAEQIRIQRDNEAGVREAASRRKSEGT